MYSLSQVVVQLLLVVLKVVVIKLVKVLKSLVLLKNRLTSTVTGVEMFRKILDEGEAGDNAGLLLRGIEKTQIRRGMVICKARFYHSAH